MFVPKILGLKLFLSAVFAICSIDFIFVFSPVTSLQTKLEFYNDNPADINYTNIEENSGVNSCAGETKKNAFRVNGDVEIEVGFDDNSKIQKGRNVKFGRKKYFVSTYIGNNDGKEERRYRKKYFPDTYIRE
ncbi:16613_t:CDS:1 [Acaulospora morrowiae]|uniref:16613_t:CDS:1 n=1 Tax=Acaulospora morrowiae TaxID=94023 RepID=A0A9N9EKN8_9GLOM|nr:16613_t:CDS:1 [Acaulospora morrowiae]